MLRCWRGEYRKWNAWILCKWTVTRKTHKMPINSRNISILAAILFEATGLLSVWHEDHCMLQTTQDWANRPKLHFTTTKCNFWTWQRKLTPLFSHSSVFNLCSLLCVLLYESVSSYIHIHWHVMTKQNSLQPQHKSKVENVELHLRSLLTYTFCIKDETIHDKCKEKIYPSL